MKPRNLADKVTPSSQAMGLPDCIAKTITLADGRVDYGRTVRDHCMIVGHVAKALLSRLPRGLREKLFPRGSELISAAHDLGKVSPTFQKKIHSAVSALQNTWPCLDEVSAEIETCWGGHAGTSQIAARDLKLGRYIPEILGQHHGYSPTVGGRSGNGEQLGGDYWQRLRSELIDELSKRLATEFPAIENPLQARVLAGLTTVSDWIGSGSFFDKADEPWESIVPHALDSAGFVAPKLISGLRFEEVFNFKPRDAQQKFIENACSRGVHILEAPMGLGKTEAALYVAYRAISSGDATGLYFALPTQITSNKIYARVNEFLNNILAPDCSHKKALLLHSNAWLLEEAEMGEDASPGGSWFSASKRGILAPFAVGTIDQALMAVMNVKHGFVRTFGLAGKVVILDEVHTYDAYTGTILDRLVESLRSLDCTVIILSATLTKQRREELLGVVSSSEAYPLISSSYDLKAQAFEVEVEPIPDVNVGILHACEMASAIDEALLRTEQGQQVLWVENTVADAQDVFKRINSGAVELGLECGLLHSRFTKIDREKNENYWVHLFGKHGASERGKRGRILVGTQVLEQSLDIDADFLVTKLCPTDLLLQRMGRLWRHDETRRPKEAKREAMILEPEPSHAEQRQNSAFGKTGKVYSLYVLYRSLEIWASKNSVSLPKDIRSLIESTYADRRESGKMQAYKQEVLDSREKLEKFALIGLSEGGKTLPESKASTRYSEEASVDVLLLKNFCRDEKAKAVLVTLLDGSNLMLSRCGSLPHVRGGVSQRAERRITLIVVAPDVNLWVKIGRKSASGKISVTIPMELLISQPGYGENLKLSTKLYPSRMRIPEFMEAG